MHAKDDGSYGYEMEIIVKADSPIQSPSEIKGRTLAFTSPTSNSGFKAPSAILKGEFDLIADRDFTPTFSGKHDNSFLEFIMETMKLHLWLICSSKNDKKRCY